MRSWRIEVLAPDSAPAQNGKSRAGPPGQNPPAPDFCFLFPVSPIIVCQFSPYRTLSHNDRSYCKRTKCSVSSIYLFSFTTCEKQPKSIEVSVGKDLRKISSIHPAWNLSHVFWARWKEFFLHALNESKTL